MISTTSNNTVCSSSRRLHSKKRLLRNDKLIYAKTMAKMAEFILENDYFEFNREVKQQILVTASRTNFAPIYTCVFMKLL